MKLGETVILPANVLTNMTQPMIKDIEKLKQDREILKSFIVRYHPEMEGWIVENFGKIENKRLRKQLKTAKIKSVGNKFLDDLTDQECDALASAYGCERR